MASSLFGQGRTGFMATLTNGIQQITSGAAKAASTISSNISSPSAKADLDWLSRSLRDRYPETLRSLRLTDANTNTNTQDDREERHKFQRLLKEYHGFDPINNWSGIYTATSEIGPLDVSLLDPIYAEAVLDADDVNEVRSVLEQQGHVDLVAHCLARVLLERTEELRNKIGMTTVLICLWPL